MRHLATLRHNTITGQALFLYDSEVLPLVAIYIFRPAFDYRAEISPIYSRYYFARRYRAGWRGDI